MFFAGTARPISRHGTRAFCEVPLAGAAAPATLVSHPAKRGFQVLVPAPGEVDERSRGDVDLIK